MKATSRCLPPRARPSARTPGGTRRLCSMPRRRCSSRMEWTRRCAGSPPRRASAWARSTGTSPRARTSSWPCIGTRSTPAPKPGPPCSRRRRHRSPRCVNGWSSSWTSWRPSTGWPPPCATTPTASPPCTRCSSSDSSPALAEILHAARDAGEVTADVAPYQLIRAIGDICAGGERADPNYDARLTIRLLLDGCRR